MWRRVGKVSWLMQIVDWKRRQKIEVASKGSGKVRLNLYLSVSDFMFFLGVACKSCNRRDSHRENIIAKSFNCYLDLSI